MGFGVTSGQTATTVIPGDGWYPDIAVAEFLQRYRLPAEYAEDLVADHLEIARMWAGNQLVSWRKAQEQQGYTTIETIPAQGSTTGAVRLYKRAVYCRAKAILLQQFATIERRESARNDAKEAPDTADRFFANARMALASLEGKPFITVGAM